MKNSQLFFFKGEIIKNHYDILQACNLCYGKMCLVNISDDFSPSQFWTLGQNTTSVQAPAASGQPSTVVWCSSFLPTPLTVPTVAQAIVGITFHLSVFLSFCYSMFLLFHVPVILSFCLSVFLSFHLPVFQCSCYSMFLLFRSLLFWVLVILCPT